MMVAEKLDLGKAYPEYYKAKAKPNIVNLEPYNYISIQGVSSPEDPKFLSALEEIYGLVYTVKFISKEKQLDFVVPKMEGFWWVEGELPFEETPKSDWHWKIVFRLPDFVGKQEYEMGIKAMQAKKKIGADHRFQFEEIHEGLSAQILHTGSYDNESASLERLFDFIEAEGFQIDGLHHEIYLNDPRKVPEEKLKTILRYSIK